MSYPDYDTFVQHESEDVQDAYVAAHRHQPGASDLYHNAWRRLDERWTHRDILHDIKGEPLEDGGAGGDRELPPPPSPPSPHVLGITDKFFTLNGQPHTLIEASDFSLFKRFLDSEGGTVAAVLEQRQSLGFNLLRVWLLNQSVIGGRNGGFDGSRIHPDDYPDFYGQLGRFVDLCGKGGLAVELTAFTQTQTLMPKVEDQRQHWARTQEAVRGRGHVILELVNEMDAHDNATDPSLLKMLPEGILGCSGSGGADSPPPGPTWNYLAYHTNDLPEWWRKVGHNAMEWADQHNVPCLSNENTRFPDRDSETNHAFDAARGAALLCAGSCFHSQGGKASVLFSGQELVCAEAWARGAKTVPLEFQHGYYRHRQDLESPDVIRVYSRTLDGAEYIVRIRK